MDPITTLPLDLRSSDTPWYFPLPPPLPLPLLYLPCLTFFLPSSFFHLFLFITLVILLLSLCLPFCFPSFLLLLAAYPSHPIHHCLSLYLLFLFASTSFLAPHYTFFLFLCISSLLKTLPSSLHCSFDLPPHLTDNGSTSYLPFLHFFLGTSASLHPFPLLSFL